MTKIINVLILCLHQPNNLKIMPKICTFNKNKNNVKIEDALFYFEQK